MAERSCETGVGMIVWKYYLMGLFDRFKQKEKVKLDFSEFLK